MNEQERVELERLRQLQARLQQDLNLLAGQLQRLEQRLSRPAPEQPLIAAQAPPAGSEPSESRPTPAIPEMPQPVPALSLSVPPIISPAATRQTTAPGAPASLPASSEHAGRDAGAARA